MEMICYVPPLELFIKGEACKAYIRNMNMLPYEWSGVGKNGTFGHLQANELLCEEYGIPEMEWDRQIARLNLDKKYTVEEDSFAEGKDVQPMNYHPTTVVYTDRSLVKENDQVDVGSGFFVKQKDNAKPPNELGYGRWEKRSEGKEGCGGGWLYVCAGE